MQINQLDLWRINAGGGAPAPSSAWWNTTSLTSVTTSVAGWNGVSSPTVTYASPALTTNGASPYSSTGGDNSKWHVGISNGLNFQDNTYFDAVVLNLTVLTLGVNWAGARIYGRKLNQATAPSATVPPGGGQYWQSNSELTIAYTEINLSNTIVGGNSFHITDIIYELMASGNWITTNHSLQLVIIPLGGNPGGDDLTLNITWNRQTQVVAFYGLSKANNRETSDTINSRIYHFMPFSAADAAVGDKQIRLIVPTDTIGGRAARSFSAANYDIADFPSVAVTSPVPKVIFTGAGIYEVPGTQFDPDDSAQPIIFGDLANDVSGTSPLAIRASGGIPLFPTLRDYLFLFACDWTPGLAVESGRELTHEFRWDWQNFPDVAQFGIFFDAEAQYKNIYIGAGPGPTCTFSQTDGSQFPYLFNYKIPVLTDPTAGYKYRGAAYWSFIQRRWYWKAWFDNEKGEIVETISGSLGRAYGIGPTDPFKVMCGWRYFGPFYGGMIIEFSQTCEPLWESLANWTTASWTRGIKTIDPRIMI